MKRVFTKIGISALIILLLTVSFLGMGTVTSLIPHSAISKNIQISSISLGANEIRHFYIDGEHSSVNDYYADAILFNMAWHIDSEKPLESYLSAKFLRGEDENDGLQTKWLFESAFEGRQANDSYSRYWHGMLVLIRPLLTIMDLSGIRILNAVTLLILAVLFIYLLIRRKLYSLMWGYITSLLLCWCVFVPTCMEYMPPFVLFHILSCMTLLWDEKLDTYWEYIFLIFGGFTCYFDFLTTEILVFAVPMLVILCMRGREGRITSSKAALTTTIRYGVFWLTGYGIFFPIKWVCASFFQSSSTVINSIVKAMSHMNGEGSKAIVDVSDVSINAIISNIGRVFPFTFCSSGVQVIVTAVISGVIILGFGLYLRKKKLPSYTGVLLLIPLIPYVRYLVLSSHAIVHGFMTHRSQIVTIMAIFALFAYTSDREKFIRLLPKKIQKWRKIK